MLAEIDERLFRIINRDWTNPLFDLVLPFWTDVQKSIFFYLFLLALLSWVLWKKNFRALHVIICCALGAALADLVNSQVLKPFFARSRPTDVILRTDYHGSYSFPSSHAADVFFIAMFLALFYPRLRIGIFSLAAVTAVSRVYCGVHYPGDIFAGAILGMLLGLIGYQLAEKLMESKFKFLFCFIFLMISPISFAAYEDPTHGKAFFPWVWEDQLKPTLKKSYDKTGIMIAGTGLVSSIMVHQYDGKVFDFSENEGNLLLGHKEATSFGKLGNGAASIALITSQVFFDSSNGVKTARAFFLTSVSHLTMAAVVKRNRPRNKTDFLPFPSSYPSGHTSSAFAVAGSLAYSYGWKGGIPAYLLASTIGLSRIKENRHWASDVVGGAFLGTFWARASFEADETNQESFTFVPMPIYDGAMISAMKSF